MAEKVLEKWSNKVRVVTIGAVSTEGGSRNAVVKVGGQASLPFLHAEGNIPHAPAIAQEIWDMEPPDLPQVLSKPFGDVLGNPLEWAAKCVEVYKSEFLCLRLQSIHPEAQNRSADEAAKLVRGLLDKVKVPFVVIGSGDEEKDNEVLPRVCEAAKGERLLVGEATQENYRTLTAACLADGHSIIAESPIDINIAKQLNILITEMGLPAERIVINPTIGALGYGLEYAYSIMERARLAALAGDGMMAMPFISLVGQEAWRAKEAKAPDSEALEWGVQEQRGPVWEATTAIACLQAGADILVMRHPQAIVMVKGLIKQLMEPYTA
jgi:acetyl-CoA decarbonylase/synthase complex subunit delta